VAALQLMDWKTTLRGEQDKEWDATLERVGHDFYHYRSYVVRSARDAGGYAVLVEMECNQGTVIIPLVIRPVREGVRDATSPYGYPGPLVVVRGDFTVDRLIEVAEQEFRDILAREKLVSVFVRMHPLLTPTSSAWAQWGDYVQHGDTISVDLTIAKEARWKQMRQNHRRDIQALEKLGFHVHDDGEWRHLEEFVSIYEETMKRVNATSDYFFPRSYYKSLKQDLGSQARLLAVTFGHDVVAAGIFVQTRQIVQYHLGGTRTEYLQRAPSKLMFHFASNFFEAQAGQLLHLGGGLAGRNDSLFNFKLGFSRLTTPFYSLRIVGDSDLYREFTEQAGRSSDDPDGFFPAYRSAPS
jgi:hypothetical protein